MRTGHDTGGGRRRCRRRAACLAAAAFGAATAAGQATARGQSHPLGTPQLNSRPGAAYTLFLDFGGFAFTGTWGGYTPGTEPAYDSQATYFNATEQSAIRQVWAATAEKYAEFNVNVTTVDPAVAAGRATSDVQRQVFYDQTAQLMHTVVGDGTWVSAGGISYVGVAPYTYGTGANGGAGSGLHTNWVFPNQTGGETGLNGIVVAETHENGHGLGLSHQADYNGSSQVNDYSTNRNATGAGSYGPVMGAPYYAQRVVFRVGTSDNGGAIQDDVGVIAANPNMGASLAEDGAGHTLATAGLLPTRPGGVVNVAAARGTIVPVSATAGNPIGVANYTSDYFAFNSSGSSVSLTVHNGGSRVTPGSTDLAPTLASTLSILDGTGNVVATAAENFSTQTETVTQTLPPGRYYAQVSSAGGQTFTFADRPGYYYDMGGYYLTGTGVTGRSAGTFYWAGGASTAQWSKIDPGGTSNWRTESAAGTDPAAAPSTTDNVLVSVAAGAANLSIMTLGGDRTVNSLTFTGTGTTAAVAPVNIAADGSTLTLSAQDGHVDASGTVSGNGVGLVVQSGAAADTLAANVYLPVGQTWQLNQAATAPLTVSGNLSAFNGSNLVVSGTGGLILTGANTYTGGTTVDGTTVAFAAGSLGTGPVVVGNSGTLRFATGNTADLTAIGRLVRVIAGGGIVDTNGDDVTLAGGVADAFAGTFTKAGAGTLTVGGASNPTAVTVRAGGLTLAAGAVVTTSPGADTTSNYPWAVGIAGSSATLTVAGGATATCVGDLYVAPVAGSTGLLTVQPGATVTTRNLYVGRTGTSVGSVVQSGGTVQQANNGLAPTAWLIGGASSTADAAAVGTYTMTGGTLNPGPSSLTVGGYGTGTLTMTGGLTTLGAGALFVGRFAGGVGTVDLSAGNGTLTANAAARVVVGGQGSGTLKVGGSSVVNAAVLSVAYGGLANTASAVVQTGGTVNATAGVVFGEQALAGVAVTGSYTLAGGTLATPSITGPNATIAGLNTAVHFDGGTLLVTGPADRFLQQLTTADVRTGGAIVDTGSNFALAYQPLVHDATLAGRDGGLTKLGGGTLSLANLATYTGPTNVAAGQLIFAGQSGASVRRQLLPGGLAIAAGASVRLGPPPLAAGRLLLVPTGLSVAGQLDLTGNDVDVVNGSLAAVTASAAAGFAGGTWNGPTGIVSTTAAADAAHLTAVGVIPNSVDGGTTPLYATFDGRPAAASDVLVRFTLYGDANLDGVVNAADFTRTDVGSVTGLTGWVNGDFNYDGTVDGSDYALADNAFNQQQPGTVAAPASAVAAVPEPAGLAVLMAVAFGSLARRRFSSRPSRRLRYPEDPDRTLTPARA